VPAFLIRHAHAGSRSGWKGDDSLRPLSPKGHQQAGRIVERLAHEPITRILSSPALRCTETVEPLGDELGCEVEVDERLSEGADPDDAIELMYQLASAVPAFCSHGDLIPKMVRRLVAKGMKIKDANISQKGSFWVVEIEDHQAVRGRYVPPG
jgi:phosphohistidine phosphatase SixA